MRTLEPPAEFCTNPVIAEDTLYRWDGVHYYKKGAALYFAAVLPQLTTPCELFVEGGATAAHLAQRLDWHHFTTHHELAPGIVRLAIPDAPTRWLTAKPGSYPWPQTVWEHLGVPLTPPRTSLL